MIALDCFGSYASLLPAVESGEHERNTPLEWEGSLDFSGPLAGRMVLRLYGPLLQTISARMWERQSPSQEEQKDAFREMINMICCNILPCIADSRAIYQMGLPRIAKRADPLPSHPPAAEVNLRFDQGRAELLLLLQKQAS